MKPAIFTQYIPAKGDKPARIKAWDHEGRSNWLALNEHQGAWVKKYPGALLSIHADAVSDFKVAYSVEGHTTAGITKHGFVWVYVD